MKWRPPGSFVLIASAIWFWSPVDAASKWSEYQNAFDAYVTDTHTVGASTLLVRNGKVVSRHHQGLADLQPPQPIDDQSIFHYGSITKTIAGITVMQLRDRGLLSLDDPVTKYLPELQRLGRDPKDERHAPGRITIRTLLQHSSGLQNPTWPWKQGQSWEPFEPTTWEQLVAMLPYQQLAFEPGSQYSYSNPAFIYLGRIVEVLTGEPWLTYVQKNVFAPLGMTRSYFSATPYYLAEHRSNNYTVIKNAAGELETITNGRDFDPGITNANGGWNAPLEDAARYMAFLIGAERGDIPTRNLYDLVLKRASLEEMWLATMPTASSRKASSPAGDYIGLSFFVIPRNGATFVGHTGGQAGFESFLYFNPATRAGIVAVFNTADKTGERSRFYVLRDMALEVLR